MSDANVLPVSAILLTLVEEDESCNMAFECTERFIPLHGDHFDKNLVGCLLNGVTNNMSSYMVPDAVLPLCVPASATFPSTLIFDCYKGDLKPVVFGKKKNVMNLAWQLRASCGEEQGDVYCKQILDAASDPSIAIMPVNMNVLFHLVCVV